MVLRLRRLLVPAVFILMASLSARAQTVVYEQTVNRDAWVRTSTAPRDTATALHRVLTVLSRHTGKNQVREGFRYSWQQTIRITEAGPKQYRLQVYLENFQCRNLTTFKSVPIGRYLIPDRVDVAATVTIVKKALDTKEKALDLKGILAGNAWVKDFADSTPGKPWPRVTVAYSEFAFDEAARPDRTLDSVLMQIGGFYSAKEELAYIAAQAKPSKVDQDADSILAQSARLNGYIARSQEIRAQSINKSLIGEGEYADFQRLIVETDSALAQGVRASLVRQQGLDELLFKKGFQAYRFGRRAEARQYLGAALSFNSNHEATLSRLASIYLEQQQYDSAARLLIHHSQTFQGTQNQRLVERAARGLEKQSISAAHAGDPALVRPIIGLLDSLCKTFPGYRCPDLSASAASGVVRADFQKMVNNARGQASQNHLDEAEAAAQQALDFAKTNALPSANEEAARYLLDQVRSRNVEQLTYQARNAFRKEQDSLGLAYARKAYGIAQRIGSRPDLLVGVINSGVKDVITNKVNESIVEAGKGNSHGAKELRRAAYQAAIDFNLEEQPDVEAVFNSMQSASTSQECSRKQAEFKKLLADGRARSVAGDYVKAAQHLESAIAMAKSDEECLISSAPARSELARIKAPVDYLNQVDRAAQLVRRRRYDSAFYAFRQAEALANGLGKLKSKLGVGISAFAEQENQPDFSAFAIKELIFKGEIDTAMAVVRRIPIKKQAKGPVAEALPVLAEALAKRDYKLMPRQQPEQCMAQYYKGEKAPKPFEKAYEKAWKEQEATR